jgi:hypothetical protein
VTWRVLPCWGGTGVGVDGTAVAVGSDGVGVGISEAAMRVELSAQPFITITAIVRKVTKNMVYVFISGLQLCMVFIAASKVW